MPTSKLRLIQYHTCHMICKQAIVVAPYGIVPGQVVSTTTHSLCRVAERVLDYQQQCDYLMELANEVRLHLHGQPPM